MHAVVSVSLISATMTRAVMAPIQPTHARAKLTFYGTIPGPNPYASALGYGTKTFPIGTLAAAYDVM